MKTKLAIQRQMDIITRKLHEKKKQEHEKETIFDYCQHEIHMLTLKCTKCGKSEAQIILEGK